MTDFTEFRIPKHKLVTTHLFPHSWAPDFWATLDLERIDAYLEQICDNGFNTVVVVVPWVGFQTHIEPIQYYQPYFERLNVLIAKIKSKQLQLILRIGYTHDTGPYSTPDAYVREVTVVVDPIVRAAWFDYLDKLWLLVKDQDHILGGFLCWEDFFWLDLCTYPLKKRLIYAKGCGYQTYLREQHSLSEINQAYQADFKHYDDVPVPEHGGLGMRLFCAFWDQQLVQAIFKPSKAHFPALTMEVRVDSEIEHHTGQYIDHHSTYNLDGDTPLVIIYYSPAWGASNEGDANALKQIYENLYTLLGQVCVHTDKPILIDQFNFIDNTPGFENNTRINEHDLADFIDGLSHVFEGSIIGYGLWALQDVPANVLRNSHFHWDYECWKLKNATQHQGWIELDTDALISQTVEIVPGENIENFKLDFELCSVANKQNSQLEISVIYQIQKLFYTEIKTKISQDWQAIHIEPMVFGCNWSLRIRNRGKPVGIRRLALYQIHQENGMFDKQGQPKNFSLTMRKLNRMLSVQAIGLPPQAPSHISLSEISPKTVKGIYKDGWMMQSAMGYISAPDPKQAAIFVIRAHVPEHWTDYANRLQLCINGQRYQANKALQPGINELRFGIIPPDPAVVMTYELKADKCYRIDSYVPETCTDNRAVSIRIVEIALINIKS